MRIIAWRTRTDGPVRPVVISSTGRWAVLFAVLAGTAFWALTRPVALAPQDLSHRPPDPNNGERVFHLGGCASCHEEDLSGGTEMESPFGLFRMPNISPDPETGIGGWTVPDFTNAMMSGISPSGQHYYPAFPYTSYARMTVQDVVDLKAFIDAQEPVKKRVGGHELRFPWNLRRGIGLWKLRYFRPGPVSRSASAHEGRDRGRYLVEGAGHCRECHTPRDRLGGFVEALELAGGPAPEGEGRVPNITPHADGLASWSEADIAYYLKSGFTPDYDTVGGSMVKVQENLARLPESDRKAIAAYLKSVPAVAEPDK